MARVVMVSRQFMIGHPKAGQPTFFVEKIWKSFSVTALGETFYQCMDDDCRELNKNVEYEVMCRFFSSLNKFTNENSSIHPKKHTIRKGKRWKTGDKVSLRCWAELPYRSKQIIIAPDLELTVKDIEIDHTGEIRIEGKFFEHAVLLAKNDGLSERDFDCWIGNNFSGQILIWNNEKLPY
jgi:hypothetical protein